MCETVHKVDSSIKISDRQVIIWEVEVEIEYGVSVESQVVRPNE